MESIIICPGCSRPVSPETEYEGLIVCPRCHRIIARSSDLAKEQARQPAEYHTPIRDDAADGDKGKTEKSGKIIGILIGCIVVIIIVMIVIDPFGLLPACSAPFTHPS